MIHQVDLLNKNVHSRGLHEKVTYFFGSEKTSTMFGKSSFIVIVLTLLSSGFAKGKPKSFDSNLKSPALTVHKKPQPIDQTFNINNWGLGKGDRKLLLEMKYKIDYLYQNWTSAKGINSCNLIKLSVN